MCGATAAFDLGSSVDCSSQVDVAENDGCSFVSKPAGTRPADAAGTTGDDRDLVGQTTAHAFFFPAFFLLFFFAVTAAAAAAVAHALASCSTRPESRSSAM